MQPCRGWDKKMKDVPASFAEEIFGKLFEEAKIARMTKKEKDNYYTSLKNLKDMNIAQIELGKMSNALLAKDNIIASMIKENAAKDNLIVSKDNLIAAVKKENAELRRKLGMN